MKQKAHDKPEPIQAQGLQVQTLKPESGASALKRADLRIDGRRASRTKAQFPGLKPFLSRAHFRTAQSAVLPGLKSGASTLAISNWKLLEISDFEETERRLAETKMPR
jgi:hypothetical protein